MFGQYNGHHIKYFQNTWTKMNKKAKYEDYLEHFKSRGRK